LTSLAVFDIDGTLTDTNAIDSECFVEALEAEYGIHSIDTDWSSYPHTTDRGIVREILRRAWSREAEEHELAAHRERFVELLSRHESRAIPGAIEFLRFLRGRGWSVVLCTGAWRDSARVKLRTAGFPDDLPLSSCDEAESREDIVRNGIALMPPADRVVVFGDAVWDVRAARNLGLPFIGVGSRSGAESAIDDYRDAEGVLALMEGASAPR
jgi:beta-phosphoglucomutase-like phosphatase (HAD superfamily)